MALTTAPAPTIRRVRAGEWAAIRDLRLRALAEAPDAFWERLADVAARPDGEWQQQIASSATDPDRILLVVDPGAGAPLLGMAGAAPEFHDQADDQADAVGVWGLWVDPAVRGTGAGARLLDAVDDWARPRGARWVVLWVNGHNTAVLDWYRRRGFEPAGRQWHDENRSDDDRRYLQLQRPLAS